MLLNPHDVSEYEMIYGVIKCGSTGILVTPYQVRLRSIIYFLENA